MNNRLFTSESVTEGHPDKLCDQVSDAVLDEILACDPDARVACETVATTGLVAVLGEITTSCYADIPSIVRRTVRDIGYDNADYGLDYKSCAVITTIDEQSPDIAMGVDSAYEVREEKHEETYNTGAGDQGMVFGFACTDTEELMPAPIAYAHNLAAALALSRRNGALPWLRPDGKAQVTVEYGEDGLPKRAAAIVLSAQHAPDVDLKTLREAVYEEIICKNLPKGFIDRKTKIFINPTGRFVIGGPQGDTGLTGRKIIVDTYGGYARHGGGAFSGKDPTKVDRSGSYMARYAAKNIVAAGLAEKCEIEIAYAIGVAAPVSVTALTFGTGRLSDERIARIIASEFDLRPGAIIDALGLRAPMYKKLAAYGHFGRRDLDLTWERTDRAEKLRSYL